MTTDEMKGYRKRVRFRVLFMFSCAVALLLLFVFSLLTGPTRVPLWEVIKVLTGSEEQDLLYHSIVVHIRLPRALAAIAGGAGLAVSGAVMQSVLRNDLASPYTLGISHAASFGAAISISLLGFESPALLYQVPAMAFLSSLVAVFVMIALSELRGATAETMVLTGVALGSLYTGGLTAIKYFSTDQELAAITFWQFGDLSRAGWTELLVISVSVTLIAIFFVYNSWNYNAMDYGDEVAKSLGVKVERTRITGMLLSSLVTAIIVSFVGIIGFVGLVVPHIVRRVIGGDATYLLPTSCLVGALLLLAADTASRSLFSPIILPVGILTSFLGAPLFIYLILTGRGR
jgi:iron complex transport system permease protein